MLAFFWSNPRFASAISIFPYRPFSETKVWSFAVAVSLQELISLLSFHLLPQIDLYFCLFLWGFKVANWLIVKHEVIAVRSWRIKLRCWGITCVRLNTIIFKAIHQIVTLVATIHVFFDDLFNLINLFHFGIWFYLILSLQSHHIKIY